MSKSGELSPQVRKYILWGSVLLSCLLPLILAVIYGNINDVQGLFKYLGIGFIILLGYLAQIFSSISDNKFKIENNDFLLTDECSKVKSYFLSLMASVGLVNLILFVIFLNSEFTLELIEHQNLILILSAIMAFFFTTWMNKLTLDSKKAILPSNRWSALIVLGLLNFGVFANLIPVINKSYSLGKPIDVQLVLKNPHEQQIDNKIEWCLDYDVKGTSDFSSKFSFCSNQYAGLKLDYPLFAKIHKGILGLRYIDEIKAPAQENFESFLKYFKDEKFLRFRDLKQFDEIKGRDSHYSISKTWEEKCNSTTPHYCRLAAYLYDLSKNDEKKIELLNKGCSFNEFMSCSGLFFAADPNIDEQLKHTDRLLQMCANEIDLPIQDGVQACDFYKDFKLKHQARTSKI